MVAVSVASLFIAVMAFAVVDCCLSWSLDAVAVGD